MIYGIYVAYYDQYKDTSLKRFVDILNSINSQVRLLVVSNNPNLVIDGYTILQGDDLTSEFSAWQVALQSLSEIKDDDFFVFGNDTFCQHRSWGVFEQYAFSKAFKVASKLRFRGMLGQTDTFGESYNILGCGASSWVSTYLFGMSGGLVKAFGNKFCIDSVGHSKIASGMDNGVIRWSNLVDPVIKKNISVWLDSKNKNGWYNKNSNDYLKEIKLKTIPNELYLSAYAVSNGFLISDVYKDTGNFVRVLFLLKKIVNKLSKYKIDSRR